MGLSFYSSSNKQKKLSILLWCFLCFRRDVPFTLYLRLSPLLWCFLCCGGGVPFAFCLLPLSFVVVISLFKREITTAVERGGGRRVEGASPPRQGERHSRRGSFFCLSLLFFVFCLSLSFVVMYSTRQLKWHNKPSQPEKIGPAVAVQLVLAAPTTRASSLFGDSPLWVFGFPRTINPQPRGLPDRLTR
jgi:hypothetical protein